MSEKFEQKILEMKRECDQRLDEFFEQYEQPSTDVELPPVSKGEVKKAKETLQKLSKTDAKKF